MALMLERARRIARKKFATARQRNRPEPTQPDYADAAVLEERIRAAIERIITLEGLEIEIGGLGL